MAMLEYSLLLLVPNHRMQQNKYLVPIAIVIAGVIIAGAVFFNSGSGGSDRPSHDGSEEPTDIVVDPVSADDHVLGNPEAEIVIVEFSDIDCPFCSQFHTTMHRIIDEYGREGQVAWVYRHFPLPQLHPNAPRKAEASECVAELGGNEAFWDYLDILFERNEGVNDLGTIAAEVGVDQNAFDACLESGRHQDRIQTDFDAARRAGGNGTPHSIVIAPGGELITLRGAQPYEVVEQAIQTILGTPQE